MKHTCKICKNKFPSILIDTLTEVDQDGNMTETQCCAICYIAEMKRVGCLDSTIEGIPDKDVTPKVIKMYYETETYLSSKGLTRKGK